MDEKTLRTYIDRIEKKFYRTKSDKLRLSELNNQVTILHHEKNLLINEFKELSNEDKKKPFCKKTFNNILNELLKMNKMERDKKKKLEDAKVQARKEIVIKKNIIKKNNQPKKHKDKKFKELQSKLLLEEYENEKLISKVSILTKDIKIYNKRIVSLIEILKLQTNQADKIMENKIYAQFKKRFSINLLKENQKLHKKNTFEVENVFNKRNSQLQNNKIIINQLYDECAILNLDIKKTKNRNNSLLEDIKELNKEGEKFNTLNKSRSELSLMIEKLRKLVDFLSHNYAQPFKRMIEKNPAYQDIDPYDYTVLTEFILKFFKNYLNFNNKLHSNLNELQMQKEMKKEKLKELDMSIKLMNPSIDKREIKMVQRNRIENSHDFLKTKRAVSFLLQLASFLSSLAIRIHTLLTSINNICHLLDFNYQFIILCPFKTVKQVNEIKTNKLHTSVVIKSSNNKRDSLNNKLGCDETEINRWLEKNLFFVMKSHSSSRIQFFYDDIIDRFKLFYDYMKEIKEKCSKEPQLKHLSLSKSNRSMEKRKQMIDKNNMKQTRSTFHKTNVN